MEPLRPLAPYPLGAPVRFRIIDRDQFRSKTTTIVFKLDALTAYHFSSLHERLLSVRVKKEEGKRRGLAGRPFLQKGPPRAPPQELIDMCDRRVVFSWNVAAPFGQTHRSAPTQALVVPVAVGRTGGTRHSLRRARAAIRRNHKNPPVSPFRKGGGKRATRQSLRTQARFSVIATPLENGGGNLQGKGIAGGTGILPVIPNRQAGSLSHHPLLPMTADRQGRRSLPEHGTSGGVGAAAGHLEVFGEGVPPGIPFSV